jgi:hypothetical protein
MQPHLSAHLPGIVMPQFTVKNKVPDLAGISNLLQPPLAMLLDKRQ